MKNPKPLPDELVAAVRRYQRNLLEEKRRNAACAADGWSDEALRKYRPSTTGKAVEKARANLDELLLREAD